jgi:hypothetical protein
VGLVQAEATALPLAPGCADYLVSSLLVHHFEPEAAVRLLRETYAAARRGLVMVDLARGWLPLLGFWLTQPVLARNRLTRHDGAISVRRAYTRAELAELAAAAGLPHARITASWPWLVLVVDQTSVAESCRD